MKLAARLTNEKGTVKVIAGDEYIDIELTDKNMTIISMRLRSIGANAWEWYAERKNDGEWNRIAIEQSDNLKGTRTGTHDGCTESHPNPDCN